MTATVNDWLRTLGLQEYAERFAANAVDLSVIPDLTEQDLRELEIPLGHRRKLLRAIADLKSEHPSTNQSSCAHSEEAERRQITVMFCDLVESTSLSTRLDPEDMRGIILRFQACVGRVITQHNGTIARYMGDGALIYFGYPNAHEDDTEQAISAALTLVDAVPKIETTCNAKLAVRIGIATGAAVVGDLLSTEAGARERSVVGDTPNLAARLQSIAEPSSVLVCTNTRRVTEGYFDYRDRGFVNLKGWDESVNVSQPLCPSRLSNRFIARHSENLIPLIGREEEIELIMRRWRTASEGDGRVVALTGEAGIGKSHITLEVEARLNEEQHSRLTYYCSPHHTNSALYPFIDELVRTAKFTNSDSHADRLAKLEAIVTREFEPVNNAIQLLSNLLSLPNALEERELQLSPKQQKEATLELLLTRFINLAASRPILILFEDAHWADPTSLELLASIVERVPEHRILLLVTSRPEFIPPWPNHAHVATVALTRLNRRDGAGIVDRVLDGRSLPDDVLRQILDRTDGVPLFIEELTKAIVESGQLQETSGQYVLSGASPNLTIPTTLQASLMARLDRLASAREVAQVGAVIGREFTFSLLSAVMEMSMELFESALQQVTESGLILQRGAIPNAIYSFKHALVRETAYASLLKSRRIKLHATLARVLESGFPEIVETQPELLAYHFSEAGLTHSAVQYWLQAGRKAAARSANLEAIAHLQKGLQAAQTLPEGPERDRMELDIVMALGPCFIATQGPKGTDALTVIMHARVLCERLGDAPEYLQVMFWVTTASVMRGQLMAARESIDVLLEQAKARGDRPALLNAIRGRAMILMFMGNLMEAHQMITLAFKTFTESSEVDQLAARAAGQDAGVADLALMSWTLWLSGQPDTAIERIEEALKRADSITHPHSQAYACYYASVLFALLNEPSRAQNFAEQCLKLSETHSFRQWSALARTLSDVLAAMLDETKSLVPVTEALAQFRNDGYQLGITAVYILLCQALLARQENEAVLQIAADGLAIVNDNFERFFEAELYRLKALALYGREDSADNDQVFCLLQRSLDTARAQNALSLELRASCDFAGFLSSDRARDLLVPICTSFTEGSGTQDLRRARAILDGLRG